MRSIGSIRAGVALAAVLLLVGFPAVGQAQSADALTRYSVERKEPAFAAVLELVPVVGHVYAGDARRGLTPALVSAGGLVVMIAGAGDINTSMITIGYLGYLGGRVWGIVSALDTANDYNTALRVRLGLTASRESGLGVGIAIPVSF